MYSGCQYRLLLCISITKVVSRPAKSESLCRVLNYSFFDQHAVIDCKNDPNSSFYPIIPFFLIFALWIETCSINSLFMPSILIGFVICFEQQNLEYKWNYTSSERKTQETFLTTTVTTGPKEGMWTSLS